MSDKFFTAWMAFWTLLAVGWIAFLIWAIVHVVNWLVTK